MQIQPCNTNANPAGQGVRQSLLTMISSRRTNGVKEESCGEVICQQLKYQVCSHHLEGSLRSGRSPCPPSLPAGSPCSPPPGSPPPWSGEVRGQFNLKKFHNFSTCSPSFPPPTALPLTATQQHKAATTKILITDHKEEITTLRERVKKRLACATAVCVCAQFLGRRSTGGSCGALCARRAAGGRGAPRKVVATLALDGNTLPTPHLVVTTQLLEPGRRRQTTLVTSTSKRSRKLLIKVFNM